MKNRPIDDVGPFNGPNADVSGQHFWTHECKTLPASYVVYTVYIIGNVRLHISITTNPHLCLINLHPSWNKQPEVIFKNSK
jgi:hypothetical protein